MRNAKWNLQEKEPLGAGVASVSPAAEVHLSVVRPLPSVCQVWGRGQAENPTTSATMLRGTPATFGSSRINTTVSPCRTVS